MTENLPGSFQSDGGFQVHRDHKWYSTPTVPDDSLGIDGDWALADDGKTYTKTGGHWAEPSTSGVSGAPTSNAQNTVTPAASVRALTLKQAPSGSNLVLEIQDTASKSVLDADGTGSLFLGHATAEALVQWRGNAPYTPADPNKPVVWQTGIDVANAPTYRDLVLAARVDADSTASDWLVIRHGGNVGNPPRLGVGVYPRDADNGTADELNGVIESKVWGTAAGVQFANFIARVRDLDSPVQTGPTFAVTSETGKIRWRVDTSGSLYCQDTDESIRVQLNSSSSVSIVTTGQIHATVENIWAQASDPRPTKIGNIGPGGEAGITAGELNLYRDNGGYWHSADYLKLDLGFSVWGASPPSQPARPVTLADVIAVLVAYGFTA